MSTASLFLVTASEVVVATQYALLEGVVGWVAVAAAFALRGTAVPSLGVQVFTFLASLVLGGAIRCILTPDNASLFTWPTAAATVGLFSMVFARTALKRRRNNGR